MQINTTGTCHCINVRGSVWLQRWEQLRASATAEDLVLIPSTHVMKEAHNCLLLQLQRNPMHLVSVDTCTHMHTHTHTYTKIK